MSTVVPSGLERATLSAAKMPLAPGLLSTMVWVPRRVSSAASSRAYWSVPPPAAKGTTMRRGCWACAVPTARTRPSRKPPRRFRDCMAMSPEWGAEMAFLSLGARAWRHASRDEKVLCSFGRNVREVSTYSEPPSEEATGAARRRNAASSSQDFTASHPSEGKATS
ncbi:hypothetical protein FQZ97_957180 [compost metagenome]